MDDVIRKVFFHNRHWVIILALNFGPLATYMHSLGSLVLLPFPMEIMALFRKSFLFRNLLFV
jgi:hypothetical protein